MLCMIYLYINKLIRAATGKQYGSNEMKTDNKGVSTCQAGENYEFFTNRGRWFIQYDFRSPITGKLFTCVASDLISARAKKDAFMKSEECLESQAESAFFNSNPELNP